MQQVNFIIYSTKKVFDDDNGNLNLKIGKMKINIEILFTWQFLRTP